MFRLIGVGGSVRGQQFDVNEGVTVIGRAENAHVRLNYEGISKKHFQITNTNGSLIVEDLGSSNGTFLNEKLIKNQYLSLGDVISIPGAVFKLVKRSDKLIKHNEQDSNFKNTNNDYSVGSFEESLISSSSNAAMNLFRNKIMKILYDFNAKYQWNSIIASLIALLTVVNIFFTIGPVLEDAHQMLIGELRLRAKQYVEEVERTNAVMLSRLQIDNINDLSLRQAESDIQSYLIFDANGRVIRPVDKLNTYINDAFAVGLVNWSKQNEDNAGRIYAKSIAEGEIGVGKAIKVMNVETQRENIVGYVAIKFKPVTLTTIAMSNRLAYVKAIVISGLSALIFFACLYFLTIRPIQEFTWQVTQVNLGKTFENKTKYLMKELSPLRKAFEQTFQRLNEYSSTNSNQWEQEDVAPYHEKLYQILSLIQGEGLVLDSSKAILYLNSKAEDLLGIRESMSQGSSLSDIIRDQGLAAQILQVCEESYLSSGLVKECNYEIKGEKNKIAVVALIGNDKEAKGYLISFKKDNGV